MKKLSLLLVLALGSARLCLALSEGDLARVRFDQHAGTQVSPDLSFQDEAGRPVRIGNYFGKTPIVLVPGYYRCPMLCTFVDDGLIGALHDLRSTVGRDFQVVNFTIDPIETPAAAAAKKTQWLRRYARAGAGDGWHCLTGSEKSIRQLTSEIGFYYAYDTATHEYAHPSGVVILTPSGKVSRTIAGVTFDAKQLREALLAAGQEKSSSVLSQLILLCYHYNPVTGKYGSFILWAIRIGGIGTVLAIGGAILWMAGRNRPARPAAAPSRV